MGRKNNFFSILRIIDSKVNFNCDTYLFFGIAFKNGLQLTSG